VSTPKPLTPRTLTIKLDEPSATNWQEIADACEEAGRNPETMATLALSLGLEVIAAKLRGEGPDFDE
jgi:hypothetical protein